MYYIQIKAIEGILKPYNLKIKVNYYLIYSYSGYTVKNKLGCCINQISIVAPLMGQFIL